ncbi:hypothetical protein DWG18_11325 [Lysobacter sp. TY2-98]|nr:hypothetical protein DWG18_11325 [Lysobacter sp. TY2-98]
MAQDDTQAAAAMMEMLQDPDGLPQADIEKDNNNWLLSHEKGLCRMLSFNDPLMLQVDPAHPEQSAMHFRVIDGTIPEKEGTTIPVILAMRDKADAEFGGYQGVALVTKDTVPAYVVQVPMKDLAEKFPNGFQVMLMDSTGEKKIMQSDTLGTRKYMTALAKCGGA